MKPQFQKLTRSAAEAYVDLKRWAFGEVVHGYVEPGITVYPYFIPPIWIRKRAAAKELVAAMARIVLRGG